MDEYEQAGREIDSALESGQDNERLQRVVDILQTTFEHYGWTGIYMVEGNDLALAAWNGPQATEHVRIPIGEGVCGAAAVSGRTEVVDDVNRDPRYLACFLSTKSEIVVPIKAGERVIGEIDVDSDQLSAFTQRDRGFLESVAEKLVRRLIRE